MMVAHNERLIIQLTLIIKPWRAGPAYVTLSLRLQMV